MLAGTTVYLEDIVGSLRAYCTGISGRDVEILSQERTHQAQKENQIALPGFLNSEKSRDETLLHYKILATLEAGVLRYSQEAISIDALPDRFRKILGRGGKKEVSLDFVLRQAGKSENYCNSFYSLLQILEFGRVRQRLRQDYPALDQDIDEFLEKKNIHRSATDGLRGKVNLNPELYERQQHLVFLGDEKRVIPYQALKNELVCRDLGYLLLFSDSGHLTSARKELAPEAVKLYEKVFPALSQPGATRSDSVRLALELLEQEFSPPPEEEKKKKETKSPLPPPLPPFPLPLPQDMSSSTVKRLQENLSLVRQVPEVTPDMETTRFVIAEWNGESKLYIKDACQVWERDVYLDYKLSTLNLSGREPSGLEPPEPDLAKQRVDPRYTFNILEVAVIRDILEVLKPEGKVRQRQLRSGKLDFSAWVQYKLERHLGMNPEARYYQRVERRNRDVAQLILWDVGGSANQYCSEAALQANLRIIDMGEYGLRHYVPAAKELGDDVMVAAYNSLGRQRVSFYPLLNFGEEYNPAELARRMKMITPRYNNHDGAVLRHALYNYLLSHPAETKILVHISDGVPEDKEHTVSSTRRDQVFEYSGSYAIADVKKALEEYSVYGVHTFGFSFAKEPQRAVLQQIWGDDYRMLKTPFGLGKNLAKLMVLKTFT